MIENLENYLISVAIGIRFRANFSIEDKLGNIVDQILYSKDSFFNPELFPLVQSIANEKKLINNETNDYLLINNSNIILEVNFEEYNQSALDEIHHYFAKDIVQGIMKEYKITQINRVGYVNRYLFTIERLAKNFLDKTIGKTFEGVDDINLRFSKRFPIEESLIQKDTYDYHNVIFNIIKKSGSKDLLISTDFQRYYDPFLETSTQIEYDSFIKGVYTYNYKRFLPWINNNYGVVNEAA
jgi:hypothetical protein